MHRLNKQHDVTALADRPGLLATQRAITDRLLGDLAVGMAEVGELLSAA